MPLRQLEISNLHLMKPVVFSGVFSSLENIRDFFAQAANEAGLADSQVYDVQLAVDEAATNIIEHAYGGEGKGEIECSYQIMPDGLKILLRDHGLPFDPQAVQTPNVPCDMCKHKNGGLGLHFMRSLMDSVDFSFEGSGGNLLTMTIMKKNTQE